MAKRPVSRPGLVAGIWLYVDDLDRSHTISQSLDTVEGSLWHAIMHRRESDFSNSKYWLRLAYDVGVLESVYGDPYAFCGFWFKKREHREKPAGASRDAAAGVGGSVRALPERRSKRSLMTKTIPALDVEAIRKEFPILATEVRGVTLAYLDNAATSQKPLLGDRGRWIATGRSRIPTFIGECIT